MNEHVPKIENNAAPNVEFAAGGKLPRSLVIVLGLLGFSVFINYIDRGNLSIAAPMLKDELHLTGAQLGTLLGAFFWTYGIAQIVSGWLVDRFNVSWVMAAGFFLWSAATSATGLAHGFLAILILRLILGVGESVAYPAYSKIMARYYPAVHRGFANSVIASGLACGPAFGMLLGGTLMSRFGWRSFFVALGLVSLFWLIPWLKWMPRGPGLPEAQHLGPAPSIFEILLQRSAWGSFAGLFCLNYLLYFVIAWLPFYLVQERHFSMDSMAKIGGAMFLTQAVSANFSGRYSDRWIASGASLTLVRKTFLVVGGFGAGLFLFASVVTPPSASIALLLMTGACIGMSSCTVWPTTQNLAGPDASGRWTGLQCAVGNFAGAVTAYVTGVILDRTGHFFWAFAVVTGFTSLGSLCWLFFVGRIEEASWQGRSWLDTLRKVSAKSVPELV